MEIIDFDNIIQLYNKNIYLFAEDFEHNIIKSIKGQNIKGIISHQHNKLYGYKCFTIEKVFREHENSLVIICQKKDVNKQILNQFKMLNIDYFYFDRVYKQYVTLLKNEFLERTYEEIINKTCDLCEAKEFQLINDIGYDDEIVLTFVCKNCCNIINIYENYEKEEFIKIDILKEKEKSYEQYAKIKYLIDNNKGVGLKFSRDNIKLLNINSGIGYLVKLIDNENENIYTKGIERDKGKINYLKDEKLRLSNKKIYDLASFDKYNVILNFEGIEREKSPKKFLRKIYDHLEDEGILIFGIPTIDKVCDPLNMLKKGVDNVFTFNTLRAYLEVVGFKIINFDITNEFTFIVKKQTPKELSIYEDFEVIKDIFDEIL